MSVVQVGSRHPGWPAALGPVTTRGGLVEVRPLHRTDGRAWRELRIADEALIAPWDATSRLTWEERHSRAQWRLHRSLLVGAARRGEVMPFAITVDGRFAGQVTVGGIQRGALRSAWVGYWVGSPFTGLGVCTAAVALVVVHMFTTAGLHRLEATIAPENVASRAVVGHLGFREEGLLRRYLDIAGGWKDHLLYALTAEEVRGGLAGLLAAGRHGR